MNRAERRRRKEEVVRHTLSFMKRNGWWRSGDRPSAPNDLIQAKKMADNPKCCRHLTCCNPRRHFGKLTHQEKAFYAIRIDES